VLDNSSFDPIHDDCVRRAVLVPTANWVFRNIQDGSSNIIALANGIHPEVRRSPRMPWRRHLGRRGRRQWGVWARDGSGRSLRSHQCILDVVHSPTRYDKASAACTPADVISSWAMDLFDLSAIASIRTHIANCRASPTAPSWATSKRACETVAHRLGHVAGESRVFLFECERGACMANVNLESGNSFPLCFHL